MKTVKRILNTLLILIFVFSFNKVMAQELSVGADIVSKYMWRGIELNAAPNFQPSLGYSNGGFSAGFWGSYSITDNGGGNYEEIDAYIGYTFTTESGDIGLILTDYYFPKAGFDLGDFDNDGLGGHTLEIAATYSGPISLIVAYNFYNDPGNNLYFEAGYSTSVGDVGLDLFVGGTTGSTDNPIYYGSEDFAIINVGIKGSKEIKITEDFSLPVFTTFMFNPKVNAGYMIFGVSL